MREMKYRNIKYITINNGKVELYKEKDKDKIKTDYYRLESKNEKTNN